MWAPVYKALSDEERVNLSKLPYDESLYKEAGGPEQELIAKFRVAKPQPIDSREIKWISATDVDRVHDALIDLYGGDAGIRHPGWVEGFIDRARNSVVMGSHDPLPSIFHKAAHIMREICTQHPYVDGQKRTGLSAAFILLGLNGYALWSRNQMEEVHYAMRIAIGDFDVDSIAKWLANRVGPLHLESGDQSIVRMLGGTSKPVRCWKCGQFLQLRGSFGFCNKDRYVYEIRAKAVGFAVGQKGRYLDVRVGAHKIGENFAAVDDRGVLFDLTDESRFGLDLTGSNRRRRIHLLFPKDPRSGPRQTTLSN